MTSRCHYVGVGAFVGGGASLSLDVGDTSKEKKYFGVVFDGGDVVKASQDVSFNGSGFSTGKGAGFGEGAFIAAKMCSVVERSAGCE